MLALEEKNGYDELILLPPPLNYLLLPLILISPFPKLMRKCSTFFKQFIFWIENLFLVIAYLLYFMMLSPYIYIKKLFLIITKIKGFLVILTYAVGWIFIGPFYLIYTNFTDVITLISILCLKQNDLVDMNLEEKHRYDIYSLVIYKDLNSALT